MSTLILEKTTANAENFLNPGINPRLLLELFPPVKSVRIQSLTIDQPTLECVNVDNSSGAGSTGERRVDSVLDQPTLNYVNIGSRSAK